MKLAGWGFRLMRRNNGTIIWIGKIKVSLYFIDEVTKRTLGREGADGRAFDLRSREDGY
jgi:hypothetical protein